MRPARLNFKACADVGSAGETDNGPGWRMLPASGRRAGGRAKVLYTHDQYDIEPVVLLVPQKHGPFPVGLEVGCRLLLVERRADAAYGDGVRDPLGQCIDLS